MAETREYSTTIRVSAARANPAVAGVKVPLRFGVPIPKGALSRLLRGWVTSPEGERFNVQVQPAVYWPDGSPRWVWVDALLPLDEQVGKAAVWGIQFQEGPPPSPPALEVPLASGRILLLRDSGEILHLEKTAAGGREFVLLPDLRDAKGRRLPWKTTRRIWLASGPLRWAYRLEGAAGRRPLFWRADVAAYPAVGLVRLKITLRNPHRARHRGGLWDLGDAGSILLQEFGLHLRFPQQSACQRFWWRAEDGPMQEEAVPCGCPPPGSTGHVRQAQVAPSDGPVWRIFQASSGGENWNSANHVDAMGRVPLPFRGYRITSARGEYAGHRAEPLVVFQTGTTTGGIWVPSFWEEFPKRIDLAADALTVALLAGLPDAPHELQGGEQKTWTLWLGFLETGEAAGIEGEKHQPVALVERLLTAVACGVTSVPELPNFLLPELPGPSPRSAEELDSRLREFAEAAAFGPEGLLQGREKIDEYGWRHFGDAYAEHEKRFYRGERPFVSHYNNQFDLLAGCIWQRWISGDARWDQIVQPLAQHVMDIDIYHTGEDRPSFNGALFWMTDHYRTAATATHRAFSRQNADRPDYGGGPSNEHNYTSGLLLSYLLTGEDDARQAVLSLANWVITMEDGRQTPFFFLDDGPTGLATATSSAEYHGPGRGAANSLNALLDAWLASGNAKYRDVAEDLIRRTIHPQDRPEERNLLAAETRWSYTMYLEVLGKYLHIKCLFAEHDQAFEYARRALLRYAAWMIEHERPYLDHAEELEYPTEAWAAQEFRKATVLARAAQFAEEPQAAVFRDRGAWFLEKAWEELNRFTTRINPRTAAIILNQAIRHPRKTPSVTTVRSCCLAQAKEPCRFPSPVQFVPQKARAKRAVASPSRWPRIAVRLLNPYNWFRLARILWRWRN